MTTRPPDPDRLLFTDASGRRVDVDDVLKGGLDGQYADRLPGLRALLRGGDPEHRFWAGYLLASWADPDGLRQLAEWAADPDHVPWGDTPISTHRFLGVDETFDLLAGAVHTSVLLYNGTPQLRALQLAAVKALLRLAPTHWLGSKLAGTLALDDDLLRQALPELNDAIQRSVGVLREGNEPFPTHELQTLLLLELLVEADDAAAASVAADLVEPLAERHRLRNLAEATRHATGPRTAAVHQRLLELLEADGGRR